MSNKSVLIVDDDASLVRVMEHHLREAGYLVRVARNGKEALLVQRSSPAPIIFTDLKMPELDGLTFIKEIREF